MRKFSASEGFSLIELVVVIVILGFLLRIGLITYNATRCKTIENIAKLTANNIKKECEMNKKLEGEEIFTRVNLKDYEIIPKDSNKCSGDVKDGAITLTSKSSCNNFSFAFNFSEGTIKEIFVEKVDPSKFVDIKPNISGATCGGYPDPLYNGGGINRWSGPHRAIDGNTRFDWHCEGNHEITFDLGKEMIIDKLETYHNGGRALNMVEIYVDGKLIKKEPNWRDKDGRIDSHGTFKKIWYLENIKGSSITYKTVKMKGEEWCDSNRKSKGCNVGSEWTNIAEVNVIAQ